VHSHLTPGGSYLKVVAPGWWKALGTP
jgi:hypothetical protein